MLGNSCLHLEESEPPKIFKKMSKKFSLPSLVDPIWLWWCRLS